MGEFGESAENNAGQRRLCGTLPVVASRVFIRPLLAAPLWSHQTCDGPRMYVINRTKVLSVTRV